MAEMNPDVAVATQIERALAAEFSRNADAPVPVADNVSLPSRTAESNVLAVTTEQALTQGRGAAAAAGEAAAPPPPPPPPPAADERLERMMAMMEAQSKEIAALKKGFKASQPLDGADAPKPTIKSLDQQMAELTQRLERTDELRVIERDLPSAEEYATLRSLPDLSELVRTTIREEKRAARERGEGDKQVSVSQAMKTIKQKYIASLKNHLQNQELLREIGLSAPAPAAPANSSRALTADLNTRGVATVKTEAKSLDEMVRRQVERALKTLGG